MTTLLVGFITFLHDLFTAVWIGGLLMLTLTILPVLKKVLGHCAETEKTVDALLKKQSKLALISIAGLLVTGLLLSKKSSAFGGLFNFDNLYNILLSIKHIVVMLMVGVSLIRLTAYKNLSLMGDMRNKKTSLFLIAANTILGVIVLLLSGLIANI